MALAIRTGQNKNTRSFKANDDNKYLTGIIENDCRVLNQIYQKFLPSIINFVVSNSGSEEEAHDVFQDGLLVIYKKLKKQELELDLSFNAYLFAVCRFIWLRQLGKKSRKNVRLDDSQPFISDVDIESDLERLEKQNFFRSKLETLPEDSKKVMKMFFSKKSLKEIAQEMGYTIDYAKKKKYTAQQLLIRTIKSDYGFMQFAY